jgi:aspartate aminotransferase
MRQFVDGGSMIRKMFEEGARLRALYGADKVFDFSIGNPNVPPPDNFKRALADIVAGDAPDLHVYMPNAGLPAARKAIAARLSREQNVPVEATHIVVTCGAAGGLNIVFKALLEPGDEVLAVAPYFLEYGFIADNHGGVLKTVPSKADFSLDLEAIACAISPKTKILIIDTPNNPTGRIYPEETLASLGALLARKGEEYGHAIYLVSDEPYRKIAYDGARVASPLASYNNAIAVTSYSKELSLPGERIGFVAVNPKAEDLDYLMGALAIANRILGFVNAPSLMQHVLARLIGEELAGGLEACVDVGVYQRKRDMLAKGLAEAGYEFALPEGAFYLFPKIPGPATQDERFLGFLKEENILVVPGSGFGAPGYFRIAYCVEDSVIQGALPGFRRAMERAMEKAGSQG